MLPRSSHVQKPVITGGMHAQTSLGEAAALGCCSLTCRLSPSSGPETSAGASGTNSAGSLSRCGTRFTKLAGREQRGAVLWDLRLDARNLGREVGVAWASASPPGGEGGWLFPPPSFFSSSSSSSLPLVTSRERDCCGSVYYD